MEVDYYSIKGEVWRYITIQLKEQCGGRLLLS